MNKYILTVLIFLGFLTIPRALAAVPSTPNYWVAHGHIISPINPYGVSLGTATATALTIQGTGTNALLTINSSTGATLLTVLANGNVGIATTNPTSQLHVAYDATSTASNKFALQLGTKALSSPSANGTYMGINAPVGFTGSFLDFQLNGTNLLKGFVNGASYMTFGSTGTNFGLTGTNLFMGGNGGLTWQIDNGQVFGAITDNNNDIGKSSGNRPRTGYFGTSILIGTTTTLSRLQVTGSTTVDPFDVSSTSGSSLLHVTQAGNVGIGNSGPTHTLQVAGDIEASAGLRLENGNFIAFGSASGEGMTGNQSANTLSLRTNATNRLTIDVNGNVGIGTTTPNATLHDYGSFARKYTVTNASTYTLATTTDNVILAASSTAAQTLNLPKCGGTTDQVEYTLKDSSGKATTQNKTITPVNGDLIDGAVSKVIASNFGVVSVFCTANSTSTPVWLITNN